MGRVLMGVVAAVLALGLAGPAAADEGPALFAWGWNSQGQLGNAGFSNRDVPGEVVTSGVLAGKRVTASSAGGQHTCVLADGEAFCWGSNAAGQLGNSGPSSPLPVAVTGLPAPVTGITASRSHTCALAAGNAYCWGNNRFGQLGSGSAMDASFPPTLVDTSGELKGKTVTAIVAGEYHTCALAQGAAYCWGLNSDGQLGNGSRTSASSPVAVATAAFGGQPVTMIRAGLWQTCALSGGNPFCWGGNRDGQLGSASTGNLGSPQPVAVSLPVASAGKSVAIRTGSLHSCALADGQPYCWGNNQFGQLGDGSTNSSGVPVPVVTSGALAGRTVTGISVGEGYACALADAQLFCWGANSYGQLGNGIRDIFLQPAAVDVTGVLAGTVARTFSAGGNHVVYVAAQVPTVPRSLVAAAGPGAVTVSLDVPQDDGGRAISGYRVSTAGGSCETAELSCTVSGLTPGQAYVFDVVARNAIGDSSVGTVSATPDAVPVVDPPVATPPAAMKVKQSFSAPKALKKRGVTVLAAKGATTSAGQPVTTTVKTKGKVKVLRKGGAVKVRSFGAKKWRVTVTHTAAGTDTAEPLSQRTVYVNGKRR